ncbi:pimeloyl-ACP methyl ester carboxylesterase [Spinactinospora alkalitolerans]|uniref:Pimeloyl-ACP methyl ester carboxylesterase n=1 Tax=Spinactinospora alkalitolerans TaxID=687207 RepID=A0A852U098_9ACTN|nr:alpha/beta hydrolase [Spinactinospora alkalitolerans]NYE48967.1 pimeloyl-ACP methyl ester carboxylesterase [Spinactinospora alkalitolerans]
MRRDEWRPPPFPNDVATDFHDGPLGRMRSRSVGRRRPDVPEVVLVQGMAVSDYLLPGLGALGAWTRAHLVELPGLSGSGEPPHELDVPEFGRCVAEWVTARRPGRVILAGHSSGTQVAARAAVGHPDVAGVVLAGPTVDPAARGLLRLLVRWRLDGRREPPGLGESHRPEWRRAGVRRLLHVVLVHLDDPIEEPVGRLEVPLLVIRGEDDRVSSEAWARRLAAMRPDGRYVQVRGAHTFPWLDPQAWSGPVRDLAARVGGP